MRTDELQLKGTGTILIRFYDASFVYSFSIHYNIFAFLAFQKPFDQFSLLNTCLKYFSCFLTLSSLTQISTYFIDILLDKIVSHDLLMNTQTHLKSLSSLILFLPFFYVKLINGFAY